MLSVHFLVLLGDARFALLASSKVGVLPELFASRATDLEFLDVDLISSSDVGQTAAWVRNNDSGHFSSFVPKRRVEAACPPALRSCSWPHFVDNRARAPV